MAKNNIFIPLINKLDTHFNNAIFLEKLTLNVHEINHTWFTKYGANKTLIHIKDCVFMPAQDEEYGPSHKFKLPNGVKLVLKNNTGDMKFINNLLSHPETKAHIVDLTIENTDLIFWTPDEFNALLNEYTTLPKDSSHIHLNSVTIGGKEIHSYAELINGHFNYDNIIDPMKQITIDKTYCENPDVIVKTTTTPENTANANKILPILPQNQFEIINKLLELGGKNEYELVKEIMTPYSINSEQMAYIEIACRNHELGGDILNFAYGHLEC